MSGKSLLDQMLADFDETQTESAPEPASGARPAARPAAPSRSFDAMDDIAAPPPSKINAAEESRVARKLEVDRAAERQRAWQDKLNAAAQRDAGMGVTEMVGLVVGSRIRVARVRDDVNGIWEVTHIDPGPAGDLSRRLTAQRPEGGDDAIQFTEPRLLDALHNGLVSRLDD